MLGLHNSASAPVAQLDRAPGYELGGRRFESFRARQFRWKVSRFGGVSSKLISFKRSSAVHGFYRGIAQSGSAPALGAGCREFESLYPELITVISSSF